MNKLIIASICFIFTILACSKDENSVSNNYATGTFVVNEGPFQTGTGTITYYDGTNAIQNVFEKENNDNVLGNIAQSMIKFNDKYFISINNANKIQIVNAKTFKAIGSIDVILPRFFAANNSKLYATSWSEDFTTGAINEIDPINFKVIKSIVINGLVDKMVIKNDVLYATIGSTPGVTHPNHVLVLDTKTNTITDTIAVGDNPNDLVIDKNGDIWVICSGFGAWPDPNLATAGSMHRISGNTSVFNYTLPTDSKGITIDAAGEYIYYLSDGKVMQHAVSNTTTVDKEITTGYYYSIGLNKDTGELFLGNPLDYQGAGKIDIIHPLTLKRKEFTSGVIPSSFYFSK